ncbi:hypothetical protein A2765_00515 [Candidatus Kaiserbacteria bacterium RIFCSPHIGHO2_01_FULL_56_24]|uniref:Ketoreductase domain-containing protein n=1 Tax=Candidatus Kaiserbacteria bacterium RIFCSPHIGHO2_01_FULL_56_24 TaxID=1798487 RepID=A0A1F6DBY2_9BACT|nr:MAG: hypothetical protein A2765_00515 [Candidatus Kaiserbacteria bacterium RIFCSPHIGHO2_01_FULL_56_24]
MLENKTMLITGSSRGIGAAVARLAKKNGAIVILHGKEDSKELAKLSKELKAEYVVFDVTDESAVQREISRLGGIDLLVNNAGISISKPFLELTSEDWLATFSTNVMGTVNVSKAVISGMLKRKRGVIVNVSSIKGYPHTAGRAAFAASKAAVITLTASMAKEFAPHIRVNAVAPGFTETETTKEAWTERIYKQISSTPIGRAAKPEEIAEVILFLASDKTNYITGQTVIVDGGYSISS